MMSGAKFTFDPYIMIKNIHGFANTILTDLFARQKQLSFGPYKT